MNKSLRILSLLVFSLILAGKTQAQVARVYDEFFQPSVTYCPSDRQYDNWKSFRAALDTSTFKWAEIQMDGTYSGGARTCTDPILVRNMAQNLKNGTGYTVNCNGYTWVVAASGTCMVGGSCVTTSDNVGFGCDGAPIACYCYSPSWQIRPAIGNSNWGGINTISCGTIPAQSMIVRIFYRVPNDAGVLDVTGLDECYDKTALFARVRNNGSNRFDSVTINWSVNGTLQTPVKVYKKFLTLQDTTVRFSASGVAMTKNTLYTIKVWSSRPNNQNDTVRNNDTITRKVLFLGLSGQPDGHDAAVCGSQQVTLTATPQNASDSLAWFPSKNSEEILGYGSTFKSPFLYSGSTYKLWVGSYSGRFYNSLSTGFTGNTAQVGSMFDVVTKSKAIDMDSASMHFWTTPGTSIDYEIYMREGSYVGSETNSNNWKKIKTGTVSSAGQNAPTTVPLDVKLKPNTTYGFYYLVTNSQYQLYYPSAQTYNGPDFNIVGGAAQSGAFSGTIGGRTVNTQFKYFILKCTGARDSVLVTVKQKPIGATIDKATPFQTTDSTSLGTLGKPDIVAKRDTISYTLTPPLGFSNSDYNTKWTLTGFSFTTLSGTPVSTGSYTTAVPSGTNPARMTFVAPSTLTDSVLLFTVSVRDLGPNFCDSTISRYIRVAPRPSPKFSFTKPVCDGESIIFTNESSTTSGNLTYEWDFGDGETSNALNPIHKYASYGVYNVRLRAIGNPYKYYTDTVIQVVVTEIPNVRVQKQSACEGIAIQLKNLTTLTTPATLTWEWDFGDGSPKVFTKDASHLYSAPGAYLVTLKASANGCVSQLQTYVYQFAKPKAGFNPPAAAVCSNNKAEFTNTSTISSGLFGQLWNFADGNLSTEYNPSHQFSAGGAYKVKLVVTSEFGCKDSTDRTVNIKSAPVVDFNSTPACSIDPTRFFNLTTEPGSFNTTYNWDFGDGTSSIVKNPVKNWTQLGPVTVKLVARTDNGCADSISKNLNIGTQPNADFTVTDVCSGAEAQFANSTTWDQGDIAYQWTFGDGGLSNNADPKHIYNVASTKTYNVTLVASIAGGCNDTVTKSITVSELPTCAFTINKYWQFGPRGIEVVAANTTYPFYNWSFGEGGNATVGSSRYQYQYDGTFTVKLTARNSVGCECTSSQDVYVSVNTSVQDITGGGYATVYPNPTIGALHVVASNGAMVKSVEVFNVIGEKILVKDKLNSGSVSLNLEGNAAGVYLVKVKTEAGVSTIRVTLSK